MLDLLAEADRSVDTIAGHLRMSRPSVREHLCVPVRGRIARYEPFWDDQLQRFQEHRSRRRND
jgi:hypothetical protein